MALCDTSCIYRSLNMAFSYENSAAVSKLKCSELFFVEPCIKVDRFVCYYWNVSLKYKMLSIVCRIAMYSTDVLAPSWTAHPPPIHRARSAAVYILISQNSLIIPIVCSWGFLGPTLHLPNFMHGEAKSYSWQKSGTFFEYLSITYHLSLLHYSLP